MNNNTANTLIWGLYGGYDCHVRYKSVWRTSSLGFAHTLNITERERTSEKNLIRKMKEKNVYDMTLIDDDVILMLCFCFVVIVMSKERLWRVGRYRYDTASNERERGIAF